ncbi:hypothetical protein [Spongiactinospora sp. TRM90649]|uniref:hypothetical protein n=1 Tax=Spongiactinospora sp. TRM90649 TaxID=3031114 RepID=UPI0023F65986|nr:hypothetical protein [Spongiactinospora sp. TRM90649]MDF5753332.1 hypothetical protein [Spongiactinospora sp. TRM90649]
MSPRRLPQDDAAEWTAEWRLPDDENSFGEPPGRHEWPELAETQTGQWGPGDQAAPGPSATPDPLPSQGWPDVTGTGHTAVYPAPHMGHDEPAAPESIEGDGSYPPDRRAVPTDRLVYPARSAAGGEDDQAPAFPGEETAAQRTGFLGSGWQGDSTTPSPGPYKGSWDGEGVAPEPRKRGRVALLSVAAVVALLGGSVAGVQIMTRASESPQVTKLAEAPSPSGSAAPPQETEADPESEEPDPTESAETTAEKKRDRATPTVTPTAAPRRTQAPRVTEEPRPRKTKPPRDRLDDQDTPPPDVKTTPKPTDEPQFREDQRRTAPPTERPTLVPTAPPDENSVDNLLEVEVDLLKQRIAGYSAGVSIVNGSAGELAGVTLTLPVNGKVTGVEGASWEQTGGSLVIRYPGRLAPGAQIELGFSALGKIKLPASCQATGATCQVK